MRRYVLGFIHQLPTRNVTTTTLWWTLNPRFRCTNILRILSRHLIAGSKHTARSEIILSMHIPPWKKLGSWINSSCNLSITGSRIYLHLFLKTLSTHKKVLLVTETPPGTPNGFGVTLTTFLSGLNCSVVFTDASFKKEVENKGFVHAHCPYHKSKKYLLLFILGLIPEWRGKYSKLWLFLFLRGKFEVVYSFFYSLENVRFASWIATHKGSQHIVHIADHSPSFFESSEFESILKSSYKRACIGQNMKDAYAEKFDLKFEVFHNYADCKNLPLPPVDHFNFNPNNPFKVLFLGSLFSHLHNSAINDICNAVRELRKRGHPFVFNLYGQRVPHDFLTDEIDGESVKHHGEIPVVERFKIMQEHHVFVVPSSFDSDLADEYCFSIPTKLPELLSSGRPTIVYGPKVMEAHRFCSDNGCGYVIDERSVEKLMISLMEIMENYRDHLSASIDQATKTQNLLSKSSQVPHFHDFLLT